MMNMKRIISGLSAVAISLGSIGLFQPAEVGARTSLKRQVVHRAGLKMPKGLGFVRNPKKATYNKVYSKTTFSIFDIFKNILKK